MSMDTGEGVFNFRKQELSLELRPTALQPPMNNEQKEAQRQYAKGFYDALRSLHTANNFDPKTTFPSVPTNILDILSPTTTAAQLTPTTQGDLQAILAAMAATPIQTPCPVTTTASKAAAPSPFPGPFNMSGTSISRLTSPILPPTSFLPSNPLPPSSAMVSAVVAAAAAHLASEPSHDRLRDVDLRGEPSEDSTDNLSERSRASSVSQSPRNMKDCSDMTILIKKPKRMSMDEQERKKLERKRARNRAAASKCRQKKMDKIAELETQVSMEKQRSQSLDMEIQQLRQTLAQLEQLMENQRIGRPQM